MRKSVMNKSVVLDQVEVELDGIRLEAGLSLGSDWTSGTGLIPDWGGGFQVDTWSTRFDLIRAGEAWICVQAAVGLFQLDPTVQLSYFSPVDCLSR